MDIPICSIKKGTALSRVIQEGKATVVDEVFMTNKLAFEALDRMLGDLKINQWEECACCYVGILGRSCQLFRVALEVTLWIPALKSFLWEYVVVEHLHTNMRVHLHGDEAAGEFAGQLLAIGDGKYPIDTSPDVCNSTA